MSDPNNHALAMHIEQILLSEESPAFLQNEISSLGSDALPILQAMAIESQRDTKFKERALVILGMLGGREVGDFIAQQLDASDEMVRSAALTALRQIGGSAHTEQVATLLDDASPVVRKEAVKTLAAIGGAASLVPLRAMAQREEGSFIGDSAREAITQIENRIT